MFRLKCSRRYGVYFEKLATRDAVGVFNPPDALTICRWLKQAQKTTACDLKIVPISSDGIFTLMTVGKHPKKLDEWGDWMVFEI